MSRDEIAATLLHAPQVTSLTNSTPGTGASDSHGRGAIVLQRAAHTQSALSARIVSRRILGHRTDQFHLRPTRPGCDRDPQALHADDLRHLPINRESAGDAIVRRGIHLARHRVAGIAANPDADRRLRRDARIALQLPLMVPQCGGARSPGRGIRVILCQRSDAFSACAAASTITMGGGTYRLLSRRSVRLCPTLIDQERVTLDIRPPTCRRRAFRRHPRIRGRSAGPHGGAATSDHSHQRPRQRARPRR